MAGAGAGEGRGQCLPGLHLQRGPHSGQRTSPALARPREISQDPHTPSDLSRAGPDPCRTTLCCPVPEWEEEDGLPQTPVIAVSGVQGGAGDSRAGQGQGG